MPNVILDACVLFPMYLRDTLLSTFEAGLYVHYWSQKILDEAIGNLINKGYMSDEGARNLETVMKAAFPEAMIEQTSPSIPLLSKKREAGARVRFYI
ncbi:hypothetical protein KBT16_07410 [Nostoc sp. CCCryo 231-06]|nr:hypothetical protein [Nostoc sp. CCCryo 231-06]